MGSKQSRWKTCSKHTVKIFGLAIGRLFVEETFDEEAKEHVSYVRHFPGTSFFLFIGKLFTPFTIIVYC